MSGKLIACFTGFSMADLTLSSERDEKYDAVISKIKALDLNVMTPLAALNTLQDIIDEIRDADSADGGSR